jgi:hypothetical protein
MLRFLPLCPLLLLLAAPAAAPAYDPIQVFRADHATAALPGPEQRTVVLRPDHGPRRTVAPPVAGCGFWAAGTGRLVWDCGATIAVTDLRGGDVHQQPNPFYAPDAEDPASFQIDRVGGDWLGGVVGAARAQDGSYYFNWRTGAHHSSNADTSPVAYPDVNAPGLFTPLCAGARRAPNKSTREDRWGAAKAAGHWTLTDDDPADAVDPVEPRVALHRCGTRDSIRIRDVRSSALTAGWLAWGADARDHVVLRHLRDGRVFHTRLVAPDDGHSLALTDAYVYSGRHRSRLPATG